MKNLKKRGITGGVITALVLGVVGLVIVIMIALFIIATLINTNILTGAQLAAVNNLSGNFTSGVNNISAQLPVVFSIAAVVLILATVGFLWFFFRKMNLGSGAGGL